jgi:O-antigen/teichoic acid export membrane protein
VLRLASNVVLARLLFPEAFGLMTIADVLARGLKMLSATGVEPAVTRDERGDDPVFLATAWTVQAIHGMILFALAVGLAFPVAMFYEEPILAGVIPLASIGLAVRGLSSTGLLSARRHMRLGLLNLNELISQALGVSAMVIWALVSPSVWALAAGGVMAAVAYLVGSYALFRVGPIRPRLDRSSLHALFHFGKWIFLASAVMFLSQQLDRMLIGELASMEVLGVYSIAMSLSMVPTDVHQRLMRHVGAPLLADQQRRDPAWLRDVYDKGRRTLDPLFLPLFGLLGGAGPVIISVLYDERYEAAGWMLSLLCVRGAMRCLVESCQTCLVQLGLARYTLVQNSARLAWIVISIPAGFALFGFPGIVGAVALSEIVVLPLMWRPMARVGVLRPLREGLAFVLFGAGYAAGWGLTMLVGA